MTRILDERDKSEIKQEMQTKNELLNQKMVAEDNAIKETMKTEDDAIKTTMKAEDDKIYNKIKNEDDAIKVTMAKEDQVLDDKIQDLTTDTTNKFTDLNKKVDDNQENMTTKVDTLGENLTSQIDILESDMINKVNALEENVANDMTDLEQDMTAKINTLEQDIDSQIDTLSQNMNTQINDLDSAKVDKDGDKVLSENDLTDELKVNYDTSYEHSQQAHAPSDAEMNVQANWAEEDDTSDSYIQNKPTLGSMAAKNVVERSDLSEAVQASLELADTSMQATDLVLRTSDGYIQYSTNGETWNNLMPVAELSGFNLHTDDDGVLYFG